MNYLEHTVENAHTMENGDMRKVVVDEDTTVLLTRIDGYFHAIGGCCTHYDAPLDEGVLAGTQVICPWHQAVFDAMSGKSEEPPALDDVPRYDVVEKDGTVTIRIPVGEKDDSGEKPPLPGMGSDDRIFVIIGGGAAGDSAAASLRDHGFGGDIVMISGDDRLPYDRTILNKTYLRGMADENQLPLRSMDFYEDRNIRLMLKTDATGIDHGAGTVSVSDGNDIGYDRLLIATGGRPRMLDIPGAELDNIHTLRSFGDAEAFLEAAEHAEHVLIAGAGFIGLESAFSLTDRGCAVTVVAPEELPFGPLFGEETGELFLRLHMERGVRFRLGHTVKAFDGDTRVDAAILDDDEEIPVDMVLVAIGIAPNTDFCDGVKKGDDGSIVVDNRLSAGNGIYAAGDVARFPDHVTGAPIRIEHWRTAQQLGALAGRNMLGENAPFDGVPFFWSSQLGLHFRYTGHAETWDRIHVDGDIMRKDFAAYYEKDGVITAVSAINRDRQMAAARELLRRRAMPDIAELKKASMDIVPFLR